MSASPLKIARGRWVAEVARVASKGYYDVPARWTNYFRSCIESEWQRRLGLPPETDLIATLKITDTMLGMIHLVGRGYRRHGPKRGPFFKSIWPPFARPEGKGYAIEFYHAFPKRDVARLLGRSAVSIQRAIDRFRGKGEGACEFRDRRLFGVVTLPTGLMIDLVLEARDGGQLCFAYAYTDYKAAREFARSASIDDLPIREYNTDWAESGMQHVAPNVREMTPSEEETRPAQSRDASSGT